MIDYFNNRVQLILICFLLIIFPSISAEADNIKSDSKTNCLIKKVFVLNEKANIDLAFLGMYLDYVISSFSGLTLTDGKTGMVEFRFDDSCENVVNNFIKNVLK